MIIRQNYGIHGGKLFYFSPKACLYDLTGHEYKILCCDWSRPDLMLSGGADNTLRIFKNKNVPQ